MKDEKRSQNKELSKKSKTLLGLSICLFSILVIISLCIWGYYACFPRNERLIVNRIQLEGKSEYWNPSDPGVNLTRRNEVIHYLDLNLGKTKLFEIAPKQLAQKLKENVPALKTVYSWRILPDTLAFELYERIPTFELPYEKYLDDDFYVLGKENCQNLDGFLPKLTILDEQNHLCAYTNGQSLQDSSAIRTALNLLNTVREEVPDMIIKSILVRQSEKQIQCIFLYKDDPLPITAILPINLTSESIRTDILTRMIPILEGNILKDKEKRVLNLLWEKMVSIPD